MWNLPGPVITPVPCALAGGFSSHVPPGRSSVAFLLLVYLLLFFFETILLLEQISSMIRVWGQWGHCCTLHSVLSLTYMEASGHGQSPLRAFVWICVHSVVSDSFATPWTAAHQASLSLEFSRHEYWSGLPLPTPGDRTWLSLASCIGRWILYHCATWEAWIWIWYLKLLCW